MSPPVTEPLLPPNGGRILDGDDEEEVLALALLLLRRVDVAVVDVVRDAHGRVAHLKVSRP